MIPLYVSSIDYQLSEINRINPKNNGLEYRAMIFKTPNSLTS